MLHVKWRAVLGLVLGLLSIQAAVHATVTILCEKCVDGFDPCLLDAKKQEMSQGSLKEGAYKLKHFSSTYHDGFSLKCFDFFP